MRDAEVFKHPGISNQRNPTRRIAMAKKHCTLILISLFLTACVSYKGTNGEWITQSLFEDLGPPARTDLVSTDWHLSVTSKEHMQEWCRTKVKKACTRGSLVVLYGYPSGEYPVKLDVQFIAWGQKPYLDDGVLYTYEYPVSDVINLGYVGEQLALHIGLPPGNLRGEELLADEFWHILGYAH